MNGMRMRFETKPGKSRASAGSLPRSRASWTIAAAVSSDVCTARITSTSFSTGTGLKKCMPITRSGRCVTAASDVIGIDDVFDARIASCRQHLVRAAEDVLLRLRVLDDRFDQQVGLDQVVDRRDSREHLVGRCAALLGEPLEALADRREAALDRTGERIVQRHAAAGCGDDLRDPAAHLPRADDEDVLELHARRLQRGGRRLRSAGAGGSNATRARASNAALAAAASGQRHAKPPPSVDVREPPVRGVHRQPRPAALQAHRERAPPSPSTSFALAAAPGRRATAARCSARVPFTVSSAWTNG